MIFALSGFAAQAVQQRTQVIPIVFVGGGDPTLTGLVRNIARREGNMTGFANLDGQLGAKQLELFKEAVPRLTRVARVFSANNFDIFPRNAFDYSPVAAAAAQLEVTIIDMLVRNAVEAEHAISAFAAEPNGGLLVSGGNAAREAIARLALYHHLPLMWGGVGGADYGFLRSHGR